MAEDIINNVETETSNQTTFRILNNEYPKSSIKFFSSDETKNSTPFNATSDQQVQYTKSFETNNQASDSSEYTNLNNNLNMIINN